MDKRNAQGRFTPGNTTGGRRGQSISTRLRDAKKDALNLVIKKSAEGDLQAIGILLAQDEK